MRKSHIKFAEECAKMIVDDFINHPEWRGINFTFEGLPDMVKGLVLVQIYTKDKNKKLEIAAHAEKIAKQILKEKQLI